MIIDANLELSAAQAVTATAYSNVIDLSIARNVGVGENLYLIVTCVVAMTDAGSDSTVLAEIWTDTAAGLGTAALAQSIGTFPALSAIGTRFVVRLQPDVINKEFMAVKYTVANGNLTTGSFTAFICHDIDALTEYAIGYTVA